MYVIGERVAVLQIPQSSTQDMRAEGVMVDGRGLAIRKIEDSTHLWRLIRMFLCSFCDGALAIKEN